MAEAAMARVEIGGVRPLGMLPDAGCRLVLDRDGLAMLAQAGMPLVPDATGALVCMGGEEFAEGWATNWSRPWDKGSDYERVVQAGRRLGSARAPRAPGGSGRARTALALPLMDRYRPAKWSSQAACLQWPRRTRCKGDSK